MKMVFLHFDGIVLDKVENLVFPHKRGLRVEPVAVHHIPTLH